MCVRLFPQENYGVTLKKGESEIQEAMERTSESNKNKLPDDMLGDSSVGKEMPRSGSNGFHNGVELGRTNENKLENRA